MASSADTMSQVMGSLLTMGWLLFTFPYRQSDPFPFQVSVSRFGQSPHSRDLRFRTRERSLESASDLVAVADGFGFGSVAINPSIPQASPPASRGRASSPSCAFRRR